MVPLLYLFKIFNSLEMITKHCVLFFALTVLMHWQVLSYYAIFSNTLFSLLSFLLYIYSLHASTNKQSSLWYSNVCLSIFLIPPKIFVPLIPAILSASLKSFVSLFFKVEGGLPLFLLELLIIMTIFPILAKLKCVLLSHLSYTSRSLTVFCCQQ